MNSDPRIPGWSFKKNTEGSLVGTSILLILALVALIIFPEPLVIIFFVLCLTLWSFVFYFFRDPDRVIKHDPHVFYSPGDGVISDITSVKENDYLNLDFVRVGMFLSVLNVHVQRAPMTGEVDFVTHQLGKNYPAYDPAASQENDQIVMGMDTKYGKIIVKQIAGILARKCLNYAKPGDNILSGQRYGLIKFGSRVELYLPPDAKILCSIGDPVMAGLSVIAEMNNGKK